MVILNRYQTYWSIKCAKVRLFSVNIKHISFLGLPWGALDTLDELKPVMDRDVQALVAELSPHKKHQMNQALGVAMRAFVALRSSC